MVRSAVWTYSPGPIGYAYDSLIFDNGAGRVIRELKRVFAARYLFRFDIVVFNYGSTLFSPLGCDLSAKKLSFKWLCGILFWCYLLACQRIELAILRLLKKKIVLVYLGDDARQKDFCLQNFEESIAVHVPDSYYPKGSDHIKQSQIRLLSRHASFIYAVNPDLLRVLPSSARFLPYLSPAHNAQAHRPLADISEGICFAHAPTNRDGKGTAVIIRAIEALNQRGKRASLDLIENLSHSDALARYKLAHVMIDQLYAGWYGTLAVEAMSMGIPAACYIREKDLEYIPQGMAREMPIIRISAASLVEDLEMNIYQDPSRLQRLSQLSVSYVRKWHNAEQISKTLLHEWLH
jgi:hypothetical protein